MVRTECLQMLLEVFWGERLPHCGLPAACALTIVPPKLTARREAAGPDCFLLSGPEHPLTPDQTFPLAEVAQDKVCCKPECPFPETGSASPREHGAAVLYL